MPDKYLSHTKKGTLTRRDFLRISSLSAVGYVFGCATDPVTGKKQFMLVSEDTEIQIDKQYSPLQFSSDFGEVQDSQLNRYVSEVGNKMAAASHRPHMPYSFRVVNATYINAYAFPGGSIAATRGILLSLDNEAELASLLGHELGHVNARHAAEQMSKGQLTQAFVGGISILPGNPNIIFFKGYCQEGMNKIEPAANEYQRYLQEVQQGKYAQHAYKRLVDWGYIK